MPMERGTHHSVANAVFEWEHGARRVAAAGGALERAADAVQGELRRRLGSTFTVQELADAYAAGTDWAEETAARAGAGDDAAMAVDAAFARYAREAADFAGGRHRAVRERG